MEHPEVVGRVSLHLTRVSETIRADMQQKLHSVRGIVSSQTGPIGPSHSRGDRADSRPSHGDRSRIPRYVSNDEVYHMSVEDLHSLYFECRDYIHDIDYVDSAYDMEHGQASIYIPMEADTCDPGPESVQIKHSEQPSVDLPSCTATPKTITCPDTAPVVSQTHDFMTSPLGAEVMTCPDMTPMASVPESVLGSQTHDPTTSPLGIEAAGIDGHHVIGRRSRKTDEDPEDGDRSQRLRRT
eukprot:Gb_15901 [translate_table: standard]